jgi:site-specific recombinase XerD
VTERRPDPEDLTVREAVQRYLRRSRRDKAESTVRTYRLDLRQFVQWCETEDIEYVRELQPLDLELYQDDRAADLEPTSLENQIGLVKRFLKFCEDIGAAADGLSETVYVPRASKTEQSRDDRLETEAATALLSHFRDRSNDLFGRKWHAILEVIWHTGARLGGVRALDLDDYDRDFRVLEFRHRPDQDTPLKNKLDGERDVAILPAVTDALDAYIEEHRFDRHDEHGRAPLFTTRSKQGRLSLTAVRSWVYQATQPCWHTDDPCPHDRERRRCEWTRSTKASQCPSSKSPHAVRTGAITFHRDRGFDPKNTAERVNASLRTIEKHYDKAGRRERMENRRRPQLEKLQLDNETDDQ